MEANGGIDKKLISQRTWYGPYQISSDLYTSLYVEIIQNSYETQDDIFDFITKTTTEFLSFVNIKTRLKNRVYSKKDTYFEFQIVAGF